MVHLCEPTAAGSSASGGGLPSGAHSDGDLSGTQAAAAAAAAAAAGSGVGVGGAAQELHGAEGVARCAFESATRLDSLDVHSLQLEAKLARTTTHYSLPTGRVVARGRAVTYYYSLLTTYW